MHLGSLAVRTGWGEVGLGCVDARLGGAGGVVGAMRPTQPCAVLRCFMSYVQALCCQLACLACMGARYFGCFSALCPSRPYPSPKSTHRPECARRLYASIHASNVAVMRHQHSWPFRGDVPYLRLLVIVQVRPS